MENFNKKRSVSEVTGYDEKEFTNYGNNNAEYCFDCFSSDSCSNSSCGDCR